MSYLSEVELETRPYEVWGSVREVNSVSSGLKELTKVFDLALGTGNAIEPHGVKSSFIQLHDTLCHNDGNVTLCGSKMFDKVHPESCHLPC